MPNLPRAGSPTRVGETISFSRLTRDGRHLTYKLKVMQQPERARACGSGPKSASDRRPVDPPPVVQMKILEGMNRKAAKDVTFGYNADFFLYVTLHHAVDNGRLTQQNGPPVLTGMPVSSMILLDRPEEAGYFIFSDLSVRHEGRYYLTFSLMEEVKEDQDKDADEAMSGIDEITGPDVVNGRHFSFRMTVNTDIFDVYSAKKFPGLKESTQLSRTVAEQGCRVRIRRDIRMRRREKGSKGKDAPSQPEQYASSKIEAPRPLRGRSSSNETNQLYQPDPRRRPSELNFTHIHHRSSFAGPDPSAHRPSYVHTGAAHYPTPHGPSMPNSPSYPPPPQTHGAYYPPRPYYAEPSPTQAYGPHGSSFSPPFRRESHYSRPQGPPLAPKIDVDTDMLKSKILPPISHLDAGASRKSSYSSQGRPSMPPLVLYPVQQREISPPGRDVYHHMLMDHTSPVFSGKPGSNGQPSPPLPLTPLSIGSGRKRTADDAFPTGQGNGATFHSELYRMQNGRREDERPEDANYRMERPIYLPRPTYRHGAVPYTMSTPSYNRASDSQIEVNFPALHG